MKIGLVLEGGAMRGMYTAGVLDTFLDKDFWVDGVISVSVLIILPSRKDEQFATTKNLCLIAAM